MSRMRGPFSLLAAFMGLALAPTIGTGPASAAAEAEAASADDAAEPPVFVPIEGLQVPIIEAGEMRGRIRLEIVLQGASAEALPTIRHDLPKFRDRAYTAALEHARLHVSADAAVDARRLSDVLDVALRDPVLKRVLIVRVSAEPA